MHWISGNIDHKQRIQKMMFPEGIRIDTEKRPYLTLKVNALFSEKRVFTKDAKDKKKGLPIISDEESFVVDYTIQISNLDLINDMNEVVASVTNSPNHYF